MKEYGAVDVKIHIFLTSALAGGERPASRPGCFTPGTYWIGGSVNPTTGLDDVEKRKIFGPTRTRTPTPRSSSPYPVDIPPPILSSGEAKLEMSDTPSDDNDYEDVK
jgi:hypothetical protein